jgi:hypothetical protein
LKSPTNDPVVPSAPQPKPPGKDAGGLGKGSGGFPGKGSGGFGGAGSAGGFPDAGGAGGFKGIPKDFCSFIVSGFQIPTVLRSGFKLPSALPSGFTLPALPVGCTPPPSVTIPAEFQSLLDKAPEATLPSAPAKFRV